MGRKCCPVCENPVLGCFIRLRSEKQIQENEIQGEMFLNHPEDINKSEQYDPRGRRDKNSLFPAMFYSHSLLLN